MGDKRRSRDERQGDLFAHAERLFPVRERSAQVRPLDLSLRIKTALGQALKECPDPAAVVAARMSEIIGREITADALYAYTAPSKADHQISVLLFIAFARATSAPWLFDVLVEDEGLVVFEQEAARMARLGLLHRHRGELEAHIRALEEELAARPVEIARRRNGGRR